MELVAAEEWEVGLSVERPVKADAAGVSWVDGECWGTYRIPDWISEAADFTISGVRRFKAPSSSFGPYLAG